MRTSVVIPSFNERSRLPVYLSTIVSYFPVDASSESEIIIVDDGSTDDSPEWCEAQASTHPHVRLIRLSRNLGKGAAVKAGVLAARGDLILVTDADGATPIHEERSLRDALESRHADIAVGSRSASFRKRRDWPGYRRVCSTIYAACAQRLLAFQVSDCQCGFKMFRKEVARRVFSTCQTTGFAFDAEVLALAAIFGYSIVEVSVEWHHKSGGSVNVSRHGLFMVSELIRIRRRVGTVNRVLRSRPAPTSRRET